ncbi:MAG: hypothetical protein WD492_01540 [Alkalispirochaeta sp.]
MKTLSAFLFQNTRIHAAARVAVVVMLLAITGCTRGSQGIFATIEVEEETKTSNLVDNTSATALVRTDIGGDERFVVQAGTKIFTRKDDVGSEWSAISAPSGYIPTFLAEINSTPSTDDVAEEVYAVFFDSDGNRDYLYELTDSSGSLSWSRINDTSWDPEDGRIRGLEGVTDRIVMSVDSGGQQGDDGYSHRLYGFEVGLTNKVELGDFDADDRGIRDVATTGDGDTVVIGDTVHYTGNLSVSDSLSQSTGAIENGRGVTAFPSSLESEGAADTFLLVTLDGKLYTSTDGGMTWIEPDGDSSIPDRSFSGVAWVDHRKLLVVGTISYQGTDIDGTTSARGYYEVTTSPGGAPYAFDFSNDDISDNYDGSELATSGIARFVYYSSDNTLFALSHGKGLWRTAYEPSGPEWFWE